MLDIKAITTYGDLLKIKDIWDSLVLKSGVQNPYLQHDWFRIAYEYFEDGNDLFILIVQDKEEAIAIVPGIIAKEKYLGFWVKKLSFLENVHTPFQDFITSGGKEEVVTAIFDFLHKNLQLWDVLELREFKEDSDTLSLLEGLCEQSNIFHNRFLISVSWSVPTNILFEDGLAKLQSRVKKEFRRKLNRLEKLGPLSFVIITDPKETEEHLQLFFKFYEQSWKGKEQNSDFYYKIAKAFGQKNEFLLLTLCLGQKPIAYTFALKSGEILFGLKTTYDSSYSAFSPGSVMFYKIFEYSFLNENICLLDFGRGNERYKQEFESIPTNQLSLLALHKRTFVSYLLFIRFKIVLFIKKKKYFDAILNSIYKNLNFFKQIPVIMKSKYLKSAKNKKTTFYLKILNVVPDGIEENGFYTKYAGLDDLDHLAVVTKAKKFTDLTERLQKEKCFLIIKNEKIEHYFWLSDPNQGFKPLALKDDRLLLTEYDIAFSELDKRSAFNIFNILCTDLVSKKYKSLILISYQYNSIVKDFIESLGFKEYDKISELIDPS